MVQHRVTGNPMGMCGLIKRNSLPEVDLGFAFVPEFWGLGYAKEAAEACVAWGRDTLGLRGLLAVVSPGNASSIRLLEALGFLRKATMTFAPGDEVEVYRIALG
jgi:RimJ/RimL family protein N-acetyltransferase